jgi:hypothetical protein
MSDDRMRAWTPVFVTAAATAAVLAALAGFPPMLRAPLVFFFVLTGPGAAIAHLLNLRDPLAWLTVMVAGSIAIAVVASEAMALARVWSPNGLLVVLAVAATSGVLVRPLGAPTAAAEVVR